MSQRLVASRSLSLSKAEFVAKSGFDKLNLQCVVTFETASSAHHRLSSLPVFLLFIWPVRPFGVLRSTLLEFSLPDLLC